MVGMDFMNSIFVGEIIKSYGENIRLIDIPFIASEKVIFHISLSFFQQVNSKLLMFECTWTTKTQIKGIDVFFSTTSYLVYLACKWRMKKVKLTLMEAHPSGM